MADHVLDHVVCGHSWVPVKGVFTKFQVQVSNVHCVEIKRNHWGIHQMYLSVLHAVVGICLNTGAWRVDFILVAMPLCLERHSRTRIMPFLCLGIILVELSQQHRWTSPVLHFQGTWTILYMAKDGIVPRATRQPDNLAIISFVSYNWYKVWNDRLTCIYVSTKKSSSLWFYVCLGTQDKLNG